MTIRREMVEAATRARAVLGDSADLVISHVLDRRRDDGGFAGRSDSSDLYYTVFALGALTAMGAETPAKSPEAYLDSFGDGDGLDFIHLACLARCWAHLGATGPSPQARQRILSRLAQWRRDDGGFAHAAESPGATAYGCFLALGAWQDLDTDMPEPDALAGALEALRCDDGAYANTPGQTLGSTPATAAAATLLRHLGKPVPDELTRWLLSRCDAGGGFRAMPLAPMPDLLSTATALHALAGTDDLPTEVRTTCLDFVESLWTGRGGFGGHWADAGSDCEYTFYGLLALGHLAGSADGSPEAPPSSNGAAS